VREAAVLVLLKGFIKYVVEMASDGMIHISGTIMIGSDIQIMLRLLLQQSERL
jgi:hypothetical protein